MKKRKSNNETDPDYVSLITKDVFTKVDRFAATIHVEVVSLLQRMSNTQSKTITLDIEMEDYHRIKDGGNHQQ